LSFDAEAFFGGKKNTRNNMRNTPDMDNFMGANFAGFSVGGRRGNYDDLNNNGFVDDLDFAHPPKASGKRTRQARLLGTDENNVAFGLQKFGNAVGRSESDLGRVNRTRRKNQKRRLEAGVELAKRNPKKYSYQKAAERLESFEETDLRRKAGVKSTRPYLTSDRNLAGERVSKAGSIIKNEIGYRVSKSRLGKKIKQLEESRRIEKRLDDPAEKAAYQERLSNMRNQPKVYRNVTRYKNDEEVHILKRKPDRSDLNDDERDRLR
jgi:hypothetical protein